MKFLLVGLGNIGPQYDHTRHNIGFAVLDNLAAHKKAVFKTERYASLAQIKHAGKDIYLIKPTTYMNLSGKAVRYWAQQLKLTPAQLLIVVDDLAIPFGKLRLRPKGSAAGHNGLKNIEELLQTQTYPRLRFGIGADFPQGRQIDFVLGQFSPQEQSHLPELIPRAGQMCLAFCTLGIEHTMSQYNN
ncbi:MAG: aminoacyl-tRNA hydrolase [Bernardetiaceae bacterium]